MSRFGWSIYEILWLWFYSRAAHLAIWSAEFAGFDCTISAQIGRLIKEQMQSGLNQPTSTCPYLSLDHSSVEKSTQTTNRDRNLKKKTFLMFMFVCCFRSQKKTNQSINKLCRWTQNVYIGCKLILRGCRLLQIRSSPRFFYNFFFATKRITHLMKNVFRLQFRAVCWGHRRLGWLWLSVHWHVARSSR